MTLVRLTETADYVDSFGTGFFLGSVLLMVAFILLASFGKTNRFKLFYWNDSDGEPSKEARLVF